MQYVYRFEQVSVDPAIPVKRILLCQECWVGARSILSTDFEFRRERLRDPGLAPTATSHSKQSFLRRRAHPSDSMSCERLCKRNHFRQTPEVSLIRDSESLGLERR